MKLHKIYTSRGDDGTTCIPDGEGVAVFSGRGSKSNPIILANQMISTLNVKLGYLYGFGMDGWIDTIQSHLVIVMGEIVSSSNLESYSSYANTYGALNARNLSEILEFLTYVESLDISIDGWVKYTCKESLPFFEACEICRIAEIYIVKLKDDGNVVSDNILKYFNFLSKMLFMMGYIVIKQKEK